MDIQQVINEYKDNKRKLNYENKMLELLHLYVNATDDVKASVITDMPLSSSFGKKIESFVMKKERVSSEIMKRTIFIKELELKCLEFEQVVDGLEELEKFIIVYKYLQRRMTKKEIILSYNKSISKATYDRNLKSAINKIIQMRQK